MKSSIIAIGDELLIGQVIDSNSAWIAQQLNGIGITVAKKWCISDDKDEISETLEEALKKSDIVLITGGLGPTKDDITKTTLANYFGTKLVFFEEAFENVKRIFAKSNRRILEINREQAMLPESCIPIPNPLGTAYGMVFKIKNQLIVSMPGVPYELEEMMNGYVLKMIQETYEVDVVYHKTILTQGAGESIIADTIEDWENQLPGHIKLAYLPKPGIVRLRLSGIAKNDSIKMEIAAQIEKLKPLLGNLIYGYDDDTLQDIIGKLLREQKMTLSTAESCTGGNISKLITSVPGSSDYFKGSVVSYANEIKIDLLRVRKNDLEKTGAVSEEVITSMALGINNLMKTDYSIASSGIAGPEGGTDQKPVGTVWLAVAGPRGVKARKYQFTHNRERNIDISSLTALNMLRKELVSKE